MTLFPPPYFLLPYTAYRLGALMRSSPCTAAMPKGKEARLPTVYAVNFTAHGGWVLGTFIGAVAGDFLPDPKLFGLDYALPAMFLALLVPQCKDQVYTAAAILSALLSVILALCGIGRWNVIVASVATSTLGALFITYRDHCFPCRSDR